MELVLVQHLIISCGLNSEVPVYKAVVVDLLKINHFLRLSLYTELWMWMCLLLSERGFNSVEWKVLMVQPSSPHVPQTFRRLRFWFSHYSTQKWNFLEFSSHC